MASLECPCGLRCAGFSGEGSDLVRVKVTYGALLLLGQVLGPLGGIQIPEEKVERNRKNMFESLQRLEEKFFGNGTFLTGHQVTLADLMCLEELMQVRDQ